MTPLHFQFSATSRVPLCSFIFWTCVSIFLGTIVATQTAMGQRVGLDEVKRSVWETTWTDNAKGTSGTARLVLNGNSGHYDISGTRGTLSNIQFFSETNDTGEWTASIQGNWSLTGRRGRFNFFARSDIRPLTFRGTWGYGGRTDAGDWNGRFVSLLQPTGGGGAVTYGPWQYNQQKAYYYRKCAFPAGGYQYVIYYKNTKPNWVYWYNPDKQVYWCACPTSSHPKWGNAIKQGKDLFLVADKKARDVEDCDFPNPGDDGANFTKGRTKDKDGSDVDLGCPPDDLP